MPDYTYYVLAPTMLSFNQWLIKNQIRRSTLRPVWRIEHVRGVGGYRLIALPGWDQGKELTRDHLNLVLDKAAVVYFLESGTTPVVEQGFIKRWDRREDKHEAGTDSHPTSGIEQGKAIGEDNL